MSEEIPKDVKALADSYAERMAAVLMGTATDESLLDLIAKAILADRSSRPAAVEGWREPVAILEAEVHRLIDTAAQYRGEDSLGATDLRKEAMLRAKGLRFAISILQAAAPSQGSTTLLEPQQEHLSSAELERKEAEK